MPGSSSDKQAASGAGANDVTKANTKGGKAEPKLPPLGTTELLERYLKLVHRSVVMRDRRPMARAMRYAVRIRRFAHQAALDSAVGEHCAGTVFDTAARAALEDAKPLIPEDVAAAAKQADKEAAELKAEQEAALKAKAKREADEKKKEEQKEKEEKARAEGKGKFGAASGSAGQASMTDDEDAEESKESGEDEAKESKKKGPFTDASKPERAAYVLYLLAAMCSQGGEHEAAARHADSLLASALEANRRSLDHLQARALQLHAASTEKSSPAAARALRPRHMHVYRTAALRHDSTTQATAAVLVLRSMVLGRELQLAGSFMSLATVPADASNAQAVRWNYFKGRVEAARLDYSDALRSFQLALRRAPTGVAGGFKRSCQQHIAVVTLLTGTVPDRDTFRRLQGTEGRDDATEQAMGPYLAVARSVRVGDLAAFGEALDLHGARLRRDGTLALVRRLRESVIQTGLQAIAKAYSVLSFEDVAGKLRLPSAEEAEYVCARAVRDGVVEAVLDHEQGVMASRERTDRYSSMEPRVAFKRRLAFCLEVRREALEGLEYPDGAFKRDEGDEQARKRRDMEESALAAALEEEDDDPEGGEPGMDDDPDMDDDFGGGDGL